MKYKILFLTVLALIIYSCASKSSVASTEIKSTEVKKSNVIIGEMIDPTDKEKKGVMIGMTSEQLQGKSLYENNCAKCHKLYDTKDFTAEEWKPIIRRMQEKAHLDDLAGQKIYNYVTIN